MWTKFEPLLVKTKWSLLENVVREKLYIKHTHTHRFTYHANTVLDYLGTLMHNNSNDNRTKSEN